MKVLLCFSIILLFLGCSESPPHIANGDIKREHYVNDQPIYRIQRDSLGYPSYYTHPEIYNIDDLRSLLRNADEVVAYNFNEGEFNSANVGEEDSYLYERYTCNLNDGAYNKRDLGPYQIRDLIDICSDTATYGGGWSGLAGVCYVPHVGFGFIEKDSVIAQVNVCFHCSGIRTVPFYKSDDLSAKGMERFKSLLDELEMDVVF